MLRRSLKLILLLILVIGASIGGTMFVLNSGTFPGPSAATAQADADDPPAPVSVSPIFAELEPFTVTLYDELRNRILYVAITLRLADDTSRTQIGDYMPEVRDRVLKVLSAQTLSAVQTAEGRQALAHSVRQSLQRPFAAPLPGPDVSDVLFTAFVVQ